MCCGKAARTDCGETFTRLPGSGLVAVYSGLLDSGDKTTAPRTVFHWELCAE